MSPKLSPMKLNAAAPAAFCLTALTLLAMRVVAEPPPAPADREIALDPSIVTHPPGTDAGDLEFMRLVEPQDDRPAAMQTATVRFVGRPGTPYAGQTVDLVGVVHIGQAEYYTALDGQLSVYDRVLYELVAPDGTRITPEDLKGRRSIVAGIQGGMKDLLGLEYQLERINYMAANFRHADMSPAEFAADMAARGDSMWKMVGRMIGASIAGQANAGGAEIGMLMALGADNRDIAMRRALAQQMLDIDAMTAGMVDANGEDTIILGRNRKAFSILRDELDAGTQTVAVFYGAGHLDDMSKRLQEDFDMVPTRTVWASAWILSDPVAGED